jgi:lipoteichoic acid synthase
MGLVFWPNSGSWITEKGTYLQATGTFTPAEGVQVDDGYVERIKTIIRNKIKFSKGIAHYNYFNYVYEALMALENPETD